eukprot:GHVO01023129.1.p1 GENE.GHVO01023129.1~~GHVO01023129.1.p1  ORF type:complete len:100 (+),score=6.14 GHVO01023129.1:278-577(+)
MVVCKNDIVRCMTLRATQSSQSPLGQNIAYLEQQRGVTMAYDNTTLKKILCNFNDLNDNQISICALANELIRVRELTDLNIDGFDNDMLDFILNEICIN